MTALLGILASFLKLVMLLAEMTRDRASEEKGYALAIKDMLEQAHRDLAEADAERMKVADIHASDPNDSAFDQEFKR